MTNLLKMLPLSDALAAAAVKGVKCRLMVRAAFPEDPVRIAVTTTDPDPLVAICLDGKRDSWVGDREQTGPERWDYFHQPKVLVDRYFLRLETSDRVAEVPLLSALWSVAFTFGWAGLENLESHIRRDCLDDDTTLVPEAGVDPAVFNTAVESLAAGTR